MRVGLGQGFLLGMAVVVVVSCGSATNTGDGQNSDLAANMDVAEDDTGATTDTTQSGDDTVGVSAEMVLIPAGTFWMGCNVTKDSNCKSDESPQHKVTLSAYYMDLTETTIEQYKACMDAGACTWQSELFDAPWVTNYPMSNVTWTQAQQYCQWRGTGYDLPTEAQWEMAARGSCEKNGSSADDPGCAAAMQTYPWGEATAICYYAVMYECGGSKPVGSTTGGDSPYGLHDMAGNVYEWTRDWYSATFYSSLQATDDPYDSASALGRVIRGGGYYDDARGLRASVRYYAKPSAASDDRGLRCVKASP